MNDKQKAALAQLVGWEVRSDDSAYLQIGCILPDGRVIDTTTGATTTVGSYPEGTVVIGMPG